MAARFEDRRKEEASKLFEDYDSATVQPGTVQGPPEALSLISKYNQLEKLYKNEQNKWWEATSLQKYLDIGRVPRGLRIFTSPTYENPNPRMLADWSANSARCTTGMLEILVKYAWEDRTIILEEIDKLTADILTQDSKTNFDEFITKMESRLGKLRKTLN